jgi:hypothetical protein
VNAAALLDFVFPPTPLMPDLSTSVQALFRSLYGALLLGTLIYTIPQARRFFVSERWGGYAESRPSIDRVQNPVAAPIVLAIWMAAACLLILGRATVAAAVVNLILCRYFFVQMRWNGVLRGMGAPGFMTYWLAAAVFFLEYARRHDPARLPLALLVFQADFALIMLSAGLYKFTAGYPRGHGMEFGMANPEWGYWWRFYQKMRPSHWVLRTLNQLAWSTEVVAAILMLIPRARFAGALLIMSSFAFIATHIRLALLCEMVILCGLLFFAPSTFAAQWLQHHLQVATPYVEQAPAWITTPIAAALWAYLILLPLAHAGLFYNFYARRRFPGVLQTAFERYTNAFGIIIWRVFSADHTNFYVDIYRENADGRRTLVSDYNRLGRYWHVGECIAVTTVFTTLKYYPGNSDLFRTRLARYARTIPRRSDEVLVFHYVALLKDRDAFRAHPIAEFRYDPRSGEIQQHMLDSQYSLSRPLTGSPIHEGSRPGSYAPVA